MTPYDLIDQLPSELQARLEADDFFEDIPVIIAEDGNLSAELSRKTSVFTRKFGKRGAAVIVLPFLLDDEHPSLNLGPMTIHPAFQVVENLSLNRDSQGTGKSARRIARRIRDVIKTAGFTGLLLNLRPGSPCIEPITLEPDNLRGLQVNFSAVEVAEPETQVQTPVFTAATTLDEGPGFTLTSPTAGAQIYYTTDDSYPSPHNTAARLYPGTPVPIPTAGMTVRTCAYKTGLIASWVTRRTLTIA